jgi:hypothetical protein
VSNLSCLRFPKKYKFLKTNNIFIVMQQFNFRSVFIPDLNRKLKKNQYENSEDFNSSHRNF